MCACVRLYVLSTGRECVCMCVHVPPNAQVRCTRCCGDMRAYQPLRKQKECCMVFGSEGIACVRALTMPAPQRSLHSQYSDVAALLLFATIALFLTARFLQRS